MSCKFYISSVTTYQSGSDSVVLLIMAPWITKSHAVRVFSVGQKYHDFSKKLRNSENQGSIKAEFLKMDREKN